MEIDLQLIPLVESLRKRARRARTISHGNPSNFLRIVLLDRKVLPDDIHFRVSSFARELIQFDQTAPVRDSALASAPNLKLGAVAAMGTDVVNVAACTQREITVSNIRNYAVNTVPEHTFTLILAPRRSLLGYRSCNEAGCWAQKKLDAKMLTALQKGAEATGSLRLLNGQNINIKFSLKGFSAALSQLQKSVEN